MSNSPSSLPTGAPLFSFTDVTVHGYGRDRLSAVNVVIDDSGVTAVTGPSGCGKSTLLRLCNRLVAPDSGRVEFRGADLADLDVLQLRRAVGLVQQRPVAFPGTVRSNLLAARPRDPSDSELEETLARVGLAPEVLGRDAKELSGGELQRVCLARTLLTGPAVLLLDEPTSSLDEENSLRVERTVMELVAGGLRALWVTHDKVQADRIAENVIIFSGPGTLVSQEEA